MTDILNYILPDQIWATGHHLETADGTALYTIVRDNQIWTMKSAKGYPWDMNTFDDQFIYQSITEADSSNPKTFKMFTSKSVSTANGGILWAPRQWDEGLCPLVTPDSTYSAYTDCSTFTEHNLGGMVMVTIEKPAEHDFGGDLGKQICAPQSYYWQTAKEVNRYVKGYGWCSWERWELENGVEVLKQSVVYNRIKPGGPPKLVFPCSIPVIV